MKKIFLLLIVVTLFSCNWIRDIGYGIKISDHELFDYDFGTIETHQDIAAWIYYNIEYRLEDGDIWSNPEITISRGSFPLMIRVGIFQSRRITLHTKR